MAGALDVEPDVDPGREDVRALLGEGHGAVMAFADLLAQQGVLKGLIGPREVPRLWSRHLLNCAAVGGLVPEHGTVVDIGSGAGLPGIVLAAMRPGTEVVLVETMERRATWLREVAHELELGNVRVIRGRAEEHSEAVLADVVTARAVAPLDRLAGWTMPYLRSGGVLLAMKGRSAHEELDAGRSALASFGGGEGEVLTLPTVAGVDSTTVVRVVRVHDRAPSEPRARRDNSRGPRRRR